MMSTQGWHRCGEVCKRSMGGDTITLMYRCNCLAQGACCLSAGFVFGFHTWRNPQEHVDAAGNWDTMSTKWYESGEPSKA